MKKVGQQCEQCQTPMGKDPFGFAIWAGGQRLLLFCGEECLKLWKLWNPV